MSGDLIRKDDQGKQRTTRKQQTTEAGEAAHALVGDMLFGSKPPPQDRTRIVLGIDATSSMDEFIPARRMTPEAAATIAEAIYAKAPSALVDIMVFRGDDKNSQQPRQLKEFKGIETAAKLTRLLQGIEHAPGWTQHCHLLRKVAERAKEQAIQQFVLITDAFEQRNPRRPDGDDLATAIIHAQRLRSLGVKISVGYKGTISGACPLDRAGVGAEQIFRNIIQANGDQGYVFLFDPGPDLKKRFEEIATMANSQAQGDRIGVQRMLEYVRTIPFEMQVGEQVPSERCTARSDKSEA